MDDVLDLKSMYEMYMRIKNKKSEIDYVIVNEVMENEEPITAADDTKEG